ncbi:MAG TPA: transglutaminase domain-containing protein [Ignavibacteriaceae bacterium]|nr:transglutaminase domain-containing protein [Ignavibacteriaceae bacterium]
MSKSYWYYIIVLIVSLSNNPSPAQKPPIEWGQIPIEDLMMTSYPYDTNATAVILCDYGETSFNDKADLEYHRHLRVKILSPAGYEWATHSVVLYTKKGIEWISDIEGITYSLDEKNEVIKTELDEDDIFEEKVDDDRTRYKFTLPALKPGCVIELRYKIESSSLWAVKDWDFQYDQPVVWSEYRITYPYCTAYACVSRGYETWAVNETEEVTQLFGGEATAYFGQGLVKCTRHRWAVKNAPALRDEPYITTIDDYINKVEIQLAGYIFPQTGKREVLSTWKSLIDELLDSKNFYDKIDDGSEIEELAAGITKNSASPEDKLKSIYNWVIKSIVWNREEWVYAEQDVDDVLESKKGNNAEITFLLISLLRQAGIAAEPVILSTRENGGIQSLYPIISQFNYVVAQAKIGSRIYYLDATNPMRPSDLMPFKILNVRGLVIKKGEPEWITISPAKGNLRKTLMSVNINEQGLLNAGIEEVYSDYYALDVRSDFNDRQEVDIIKEQYDSEANGLIIDSVSIANKDSIYSPLQVKSRISSENYCTKSGDIIYFNPILIHRMKENPFKSAKRNFPIDYGYPSSYSIIENITIPENYEIKETLGDKNFKLSPNIGSYTRQIKTEGNQISITYNFEIRQSVINSKFYEQLKAFYARIAASQGEQFVFIRKGV